MIKFFKTYIVGLRVKLICFIFLAITINILSLVQPLIIGNGINIIIDTNLKLDYRKQNILEIVIVLFGIFIIMTILQYILKVTLEYLIAKITFNLKFELIQKLQKASLRFVEQMDKTYITQRIENDAFTFISFIINGAINVIITIITLLYIGIIFLTYSKLSLIILAIVGPIYFAVYKTFKDSLYAKNLEYKESANKYYSCQQEQISEIKFIKINVVEKFMLAKFTSGFNEYLSNVLKYAKELFIFSSLGNSVGQVLMLVFILVGGIQVIYGELSIGLFTSLNSYFSQFVGKMSYIVEFSSSYQEAKVSFNRLLELYNIEQVQTNSIYLESIDNIKFEEVSFAYDKKKVIKNFSQEFSKGTIYNVKGENGSGKSTLLNLLIGLYNNYEGKILFNDIDIKTLNMDHIRKKLIAMVEQEPILLNDTVVNNIVLDLQNKDINEFIDILQLQELIEKNKNNNIDKNIVSGGEKQKISIARSLLKKGDVLVLDEFNSALDIKTNENLKLILNKLKKEIIIIMITHSSIYDDISDCIINLDYNNIKIHKFN